MASRSRRTDRAAGDGGTHVALPLVVALAAAACGSGRISAAESSGDAGRDAITVNGEPHHNGTKSAKKTSGPPPTQDRDAASQDETNSPSLDAAPVPAVMASTGADGPAPTTEEDAGTLNPPQSPPTELANYVFVTSTAHLPNFGGLAGADAICNARASAAGLPGRYVAWLSTSDQDAKDRLPEAARGWARPDQRPFAASRASLLAGAVLYPARCTESGDDLYADASPVITATAADGTFSHTGNYSDCGGFTAISTALYRSGSPAGGSFQWTAADGANCAQPGRLFCFGVDDAATIQPPAEAPGRIAFLSTSSYLPGSGLAGADALCDRDANSAGRSGTFRALLAIDGASAASRLGDGAAWQRPDGVTVLDSAANLRAGMLPLASIDVQADGAYRGSVGVWSGADAPERAPAAASHCENWSDAASNGEYGVSGFSLPSFFAFDLVPCDTTYLHVYCFED